MTYVAAVPAEAWAAAKGGASLAMLSRDALSAERRLSKDINVEVEGSRYALICQSIEDTAKALPSLAAEDDPAIVDWPADKVIRISLPAGYLIAIRRLASLTEPTLRLGTTFIPPEQVAEHVRGVQDVLDKLEGSLEGSVLTLLTKRLTFLEFASKDNRGIVEFQNAFCQTDGTSTIRLDQDAYEASFEENVPSSGQEAPDDISLEAAVRQRIRSVIAGGAGPINLGGLPHSMITDVLREFCYRDSVDSAAVSAHVVYDDGSEGPPIALRSLPEPALPPVRTWAGTPLRVGLISMRHLELDHQIDVSWFRNREASKSRTLGEADAACYELSLQQFEKSRGQGDLLIYLLQTGFQPAVVGFFRALVEELRVRCGAPELVVIPQYFSRDGRLVRTGVPWC